MIQIACEKGLKGTKQVFLLYVDSEFCSDFISKFQVVS